jgi:hypothetical protein
MIGHTQASDFKVLNLANIYWPPPTPALFPLPPPPLSPPPVGETVVNPRSDKTPPPPSWRPQPSSDHSDII